MSEFTEKQPRLIILEEDTYAADMIESITPPFGFIPDVCKNLEQYERAINGNSDPIIIDFNTAGVDQEAAVRLALATGQDHQIIGETDDPADRARYPGIFFTHAYDPTEALEAARNLGSTAIYSPARTTA